VGGKKLADLVALHTVFLVPSPCFTVLRLDALPIGTGVLVVINLAVLRWIFRRVRMVWWYPWFGTMFEA
jgi:hypothetical protein